MTAPPANRSRSFVLLALRAAAVAGIGMTLAGCLTQREVKRYPPNDYRERHPIALREGDRTIEIFVGRNRGGLNPSQRADVLAFAQIWRHEGTGGIAVDIPTGETRMAAEDSMREIHSIFAQSGVPRQGVRERSYEPRAGSLASIRLSYSKIVAEAGPCGQWPADLGPANEPSYQDNQQYYNLGCATQRNLAAMVANKSDLVQPRGETPAYAARRSVAIDKYRRGDNPAGTYDRYDTGKISDLGK